MRKKSRVYNIKDMKEVLIIINFWYYLNDRKRFKKMVFIVLYIVIKVVECSENIMLFRSENSYVFGTWLFDIK